MTNFSHGIAKDSRRPFAGHRDSVSDVIGQTVEIAIEEVLHEHGISARKTKRAERVKGFEQTPDFIVPPGAVSNNAAKT